MLSICFRRPRSPFFPASTVASISTPSTVLYLQRDRVSWVRSSVRPCFVYSGPVIQGTYQRRAFGRGCIETPLSSVKSGGIFENIHEGGAWLPRVFLGMVLDMLCKHPVRLRDARMDGPPVHLGTALSGQRPLASFHSDDGLLDFSHLPAHTEAHTHQKPILVHSIYDICDSVKPPNRIDRKLDCKR